MTDLAKVIDHVGRTSIANRCGVTYAAVLKWRKRGVLPRTDYTGETDYAGAIAELSQGEFSREDLLRPISNSQSS